jgi:hypothetical protein
MTGKIIMKYRTYACAIMALILVSALFSINTLAAKPTPQGSITKMTATPVAFNPDKGSTTVSYYLNGVPATSGQVRIDIYSNANKLVRTINAGVQKTGQHSFKWDGRDNKGAIVSDGSYKIIVTSTCKKKSYTASTTVILDRAPPLISIASPASSPPYGRYFNIKVSFSATDPTSGLVKAPTGTDGIVVLASGDTFTTTGTGAHTFTVTAQDKAGNVGVKSVTYTVIMG